MMLFNLLIVCAGVCPAGKAIGDIPSASNKAHAMAECSNRGMCNRQSGQCRCFPPFTGSACEKSKRFLPSIVKILIIAHDFTPMLANGALWRL